MIIPYQKYVEVKRYIDSLLKSNQVPTIEHADELDIGYDSLLSLYSQMQVRVMRRDARRFDAKSVRAIVRRVHDGHACLSAIAREHCFSGYRLATMYLECVTGANGKDSISVSDLRETPNLLAHFFDKTRGQSMLQKSLTASRNTDPDMAVDLNIPPERVDAIAADILSKCYAEDSCCNWGSDVSKQVMGQEYEEHLMGLLDHLGTCYDSEEVLRGKGKAKTPDILFAIPMGVNLPHYRSPIENPSVGRVRSTTVGENLRQQQQQHGSPRSPEASSSLLETRGGNTAVTGEVSANARNINMKLFSEGDAESDDSPDTGGHAARTTSAVAGSTDNHYVVINWIDSKALCADEESFQQNLDQVQSYVNR
jgi:hypothetical protein